MFDKEKGAYDPKKIHKINFNGKHHKTSAIAPTHPSPQRTPVIFQAGASPAGKAFAAGHAEAIFVGGAKPASTAEYVKEVRAAAAANGRNSQHIKVFPQICPIIGRTIEEAQAKHDRYKACADWRGGLAKLSQYLNCDLASFPLDEPFDAKSLGTSDNAIHTMINMMKSFDTPVTPRMLGEK